MQAVKKNNWAISAKLTLTSITIVFSEDLRKTRYYLTSTHFWKSKNVFRIPSNLSNLGTLMNLWMRSILDYIHKSKSKRLVTDLQV